MKKIIRTAVAFGTMACALASCSKGGDLGPTIHSHPEVLTEAGTYPIIKDEYKGKVKFKVMGANNDAINPDWASNKFFTRMTELTGCEYTFQVFGSGAYDQQKALTLSTQSGLPDIFIKGNLSNYDEVTYGGKVLRPLNDLIDNYAPNIKALLDSNKIIKKSITTTDGKIYALPTIYTNLPEGTDTIMRGFFWVNKDWMGTTTMPKTPAQFKTLLQKFKDDKHLTAANQSPLVIAGTDNLLKLFNIFGLDLANYWVQPGTNDQLIFGPTTSTFKQALRYIKELIDGGLMNSNWASLTATEMQSIGQQSGDHYGCFIQAAPQYVVGFNRMKEYTTLDPMSLDGFDGFWSATNPLQRGCFALTYQCEYPEAAIRYMDSLYDISKPYGLWCTIGKEGEEWQWQDAEKTKWKSTVSEQQYAEVMKDTIIQTGDGMPYAVDESFFGKQATESDIYTRPLRNRQMGFGKVGYPDVYFTVDQINQIADLAIDINNYINRYIAAILSGTKDLDSTWNDFVAFSGLELDQYMSLLQARYNDFVAATK